MVLTMSRLKPLCFSSSATKKKHSFCSDCWNSQKSYWTKPVSNNITLRVELNKNYSTKKLDKDPNGYKFDSVNGDTEGTATEDKEVIYYYKKIKEVKPAEEVPKTGDNIVTLISTFIVSLTLMIVLLFIKKKQKAK